MNETKLFHRAEKGESTSISPETNAHEYLAVCPKCKNVETILYMEGHFLTNRKFYETEVGVFHNCGSEIPCNLYGIYS
jgi:hypothetical protein